MLPSFLFIPDFIQKHEELTQFLIDNIEWDERMKARKTASFGVAYNYSQIDYPDTLFPNWLEELANLVESTIGFYPNNCLLNFYPDGKSSMGFHSDTATGRTVGTGVAIVSLGHPRKMQFKSKSNPDKTSERVLTPGSLIYLDDETENDWLHAIPKSENAGPRISLSFRSIQVEA